MNVAPVRRRFLFVYVSTVCDDLVLHVYAWVWQPGTGASFVVTSPRDDVHQRKCPATTRRPCVVHPSSPLHIRHVFVRQRASSAPPFLYRRSCPTEHTNTKMPATPGCQTQAYTCKTRSSQTILTYTNEKHYLPIIKDTA